jgi:hypothetical protein
MSFDCVGSAIKIKNLLIRKAFITRTKVFAVDSGVMSCFRVVGTLQKEGPWLVSVVFQVVMSLPAEPRFIASLAPYSSCRLTALAPAPGCRIHFPSVAARQPRTCGSFVLSHRIVPILLRWESMVFLLGPGSWSGHD